MQRVIVSVMSTCACSHVPATPSLVAPTGVECGARTAPVCSAVRASGDYPGETSQALCRGRRRIAMSQRRARKAQKLGPLAGAGAAADTAQTLDPAHAGAEASPAQPAPAATAAAAGTPALAAQGSAADARAAEPALAGLAPGDQPETTRAAEPGQLGVAPGGPAAGKQSRKRRGSRRADSEETRRSLYHGVTWSRKVGKWRAQVRPAWWGEGPGLHPCAHGGLCVTSHSCRCSLALCVHGLQGRIG